MAPRFSLGVAVAVAALSVSSLARAQTPDLLRPIDSVELWDKQLGQLTQMAWNANSISAILGPDPAGRLLARDWDENVLAADVKGRLDELHAKAVAQSATGDSEGLKRTFAEATPIMRSQAYRSFVVLAYWMSQDQLTYHASLLQPLLDRASAEERKLVSDRVSATFDMLRNDYAVALQSDEPSSSLPSPRLIAARDTLEFLNDERVSLLKQQADLPNLFEIAPLKRTEPCTVSNAPKPSSRKPSIALDSPSSEPYYPAEMKRRGVTGDVFVTVAVSATGCADTASVAASSGVKELDEAALKYAVAGRYVPAADGNEAVPGELKFRIAFRLEDAPSLEP